MISVTSKPDKKYVGIPETLLKDLFNNHIRGFCRKKYVNSTELSEYKWKDEKKMKDEKITLSIKWNIMSIVHGTP